MRPCIRREAGLAHHQLDVRELSQGFKHGQRHAKGHTRIAPFEPGQGLPVNTASAFEFDQ